MSAITKTITFEDQNKSPTEKSNASSAISFSQMVHPKSQMIFQSNKNTKINLDSPIVLKNSSPSVVSLQVSSHSDPNAEKLGFINTKGKLIR